MTTEINITLAIPAYNRPAELAELIDSIICQVDEERHELLIIEDCSPDRDKIRDVVSSYSFPIRYIENERNLGYDGNLRRLIKEARGSFILFMGNDDILAPSAISYYEEIVNKFGSDIGFVLRSYCEFDNSTKAVGRTIRYLDTDTVLEPSEVNSAFVFRRSVAIMGMFYNAKLAKALDTDKYDGSIYYQLWLSGNIALKHRVFVASFPTAYRRCGLKPDFGNSESERKSVVGNYYSSIAFSNYVKNMLSIANDVSVKNQASLFYRIVCKDFSSYSYPFLAPVRSMGLFEYLKHYKNMKSTGVASGVLFNFYYFSLLVLGRKPMDLLIRNCGKAFRTTSIFWRHALDK